VSVTLPLMILTGSADAASDRYVETHSILVDVDDCCLVTIGSVIATEIEIVRLTLESRPV
jgi:hypothetical protein